MPIQSLDKMFGTRNINMKMDMGGTLRCYKRQNAEQRGKKIGVGLFVVQNLQNLKIHNVKVFNFY